MMGQIIRGNLFPTSLEQPLLEDGTNKLSRNVGNQLSILAA